MAFSLSYAFGRMGRHVRKISREARSFVGTKFRRLEPSPLREFLFTQYFAIDTTIFQVFYSDQGDALYPLHLKYGNKLVDATGCDFLEICRIYACSLLIEQGVGGISATEQQSAIGFDVLRVIDDIYGRSEPDKLWASLVLEPDNSMVAAAICQGIARVLKVAPKDKASFANDWLFLIPHINSAMNSLLATPDWARTAASLLESGDFGGSGR